MRPGEIGALTIRAEAAALLRLASRLDTAFEAAIDLLAATPGKVVTTGMGKAGLMAHKFAATLCSTAKPACYLHPGDAKHGDLGLLQPGDVLFVISVSGETHEVIECVRQAVALINCRVIVMTSRPFSTLGREASIVLDLGDVDEACPLGLTPTTSMVLTLAYCDAMAIALMKERNVTREDFAARHHGGYLGAQARKPLKAAS